MGCWGMGITQSDVLYFISKRNEMNEVLFAVDQSLLGA